MSFQLLYNKHLYLDGSKLEETGFQYERPYLEISSLQELSFQLLCNKHLYLDGSN